MQQSVVNVSPLVGNGTKMTDERKMEMDDRIMESIDAMSDIKNINCDKFYEEHGTYESIPNSQEKFKHKNDYNEYGLGIRIVDVNGKELIYHTGSTIGTNTLLLFSLDLNLCVIFLTNINNNSTTKIKEHLVEYFINN